MKEEVLVILILLVKGLKHSIFLLDAILDLAQIFRHLSVILTL